MYFASCVCIVEELWLSRSEPAVVRRCVRGPTPPIKIEGTSLLNRTGLESEIVGVRRFWIDVQVERENVKQFRSASARHNGQAPAIV